MADIGADTAGFGPNRAALERTVTELFAAGRLTDLDAARIEAARQLAAAVDREPDSAALWREYRAAEKAIREESEVTENDPFQELLKAFDTAIRDEAPEEKPKPRR